MNYQNIKINSKEYNCLSNEEKLKMIKFKLKELFDDNSKYSINVMYKGRNIKVSRDKFNYLKHLVSLEKKLETTINVKTDKKDITKGQSVEKNHSDYDFIGIVEQKRLKKEELIEKRKVKKNKFLSFFREKMYEKQINKRNKKRIKKKRITAFVCALILTMTGFAGLRKSVEKGNTGYVPTTRVVTVKSAVNNTNNISNNVEKTIEKDTFELSDKVDIEENAPIYSNSYDAISNNNGTNAAYDYSYERTIKGLSYELDGKIYTVYQNEIDSDKKVDILVKSGTTLKAVLVSRSDLEEENTYEGYYNVSNIRVRSLTNG